MNIGKEQKQYILEPINEPKWITEPEPSPIREPLPKREKEPVPA